MTDFQNIDLQATSTGSRAVTRFAHDLMVGVVNSGVVNDRNMTRAIEVMRAEAKAFLTGDDYADERAAVLANSVHPGHVMASVVASCVIKIRAE